MRTPLAFSTLTLSRLLGTSESTKFIFPMEFTNLLNPFINAATGAAAGNSRDGD